MKLVWHADNLWEGDWLREMLKGLVGEEVVDLDLTCFDDDTVHVVSSNWRPLPFYEDYARQLRARCGRIALIHLSDEWFSGGYGLYASFDAVIRNFKTYLADDGVVLTIPEGYSDDIPRGRPIRPPDERRFAWSFVGEVKASRVEMVDAFAGFDPCYLTATASISDAGGKKLSKSEYAAIMEDTVFSPCPMGNVILETWRLYESLELGCIPLAERRLTLDYFETLFGPNPIPRFLKWRDARRFAEALFADKQALARKQAEIGAWWSDHKAAVRGDIRAALRGPSRSAELKRFAGRLRNRSPLLYEPLRLAELVRHQSGSSLRRRLSKPAGPLQRIVRDGLRRARP